METTSKIVRARATVRRTCDGRNFTGWVVAVIGREVTLRLTDSNEIEQGELVTVEVESPERLACFLGTVEGGIHNTVDVHISGEVTYSPPRRQGRLYTTNVSCDLKNVGSELRARVVDVGPGGVGMLVSRIIPKGTKLSVAIKTGDHQVEGVVTSVYCQREEQERGWFRAGFTLAELSDNDYGIWLAVFNRLDPKFNPRNVNPGSAA